MGFGDAIQSSKAGKRVVRSGWNGTNLWLELQVQDAHSKTPLPHIVMKTVDGGVVP
jgi:hypothetical protein